MKDRLNRLLAYIQSELVKGRLTAVQAEVMSNEIKAAMPVEDDGK